MSATPEGSLVPQQGWWGRNWKWVVPVGCLGLLASCGCLGFVVVGLGVSSVTQNMGAYTEAVSIATNDAQVRKVMGAPIKASGFPKQTQVNSINGVTRAQLAIPLDGPQADGMLQVDARKEGDGDWHYDVLTVEVEGGTRIDLRDDAPSERDLLPEGDDSGEPPPPPLEEEEPPRRDAPKPGSGKDSDIEL
ncbi:hypothetical protein MYSTI_06536 [Myxococcus stipitatus DSM 14675]|uniref:Uncharacterized protein n=1 Tax=Myxococcus stipitatus (strain DSM 14675 / JCM 12634 / Mx s8) TaxID=1278073 RepID=L7UMW4_MYXSD|nr:cytochrome c oxidase assembly factor Coa1 family protein [Myxococcus stipitatus]AGC47809.1 hypothetical protein MYSTI_06536 [Myxococcus stipitatus DSM 14675]